LKLEVVDAEKHWSVKVFIPKVGAAAVLRVRLRGVKPSV